MAVSRLSSPLIVVAVSSVLLLNVIITTAAAGKKESIASTDWRSMWYKLFDEDFDFDTVFKKLTELKALFDSHLVPEEWIKYGNLIDDLLKIKELDEKSCEDRLITNIGNFIESSTSDNSIIRYAKNYGYPQLVACTQLIVNDAEKAIKAIDPAYRDDMILLRNSVKPKIEGARKKRFFEMNYVEEYVEGIKKILNQRYMNGSEAEDTKPYLYYKEHVINPCKFWLQATDRLRRISPFTYTIGGPLKSSIEFGDICDYIKSTKKVLEKRLFLDK